MSYDVARCVDGKQQAKRCVQARLHVHGKAAEQLDKAAQTRSTDFRKIIAQMAVASRKTTQDTGRYQPTESGLHAGLPEQAWGLVAWVGIPTATLEERRWAFEEHRLDPRLSATKGSLVRASKKILAWVGLATCNGARLLKPRKSVGVDCRKDTGPWARPGSRARL